MQVLARLQKRLRGAAGVPLYVVIEEELESLIESGVFGPGERLPGDAELSGKLGVNHLTVRRGLDGLVKKGLIVRRRRAGTFVRPTDRGEKRRSIGYFYMREDEVRKLRSAEAAQVCLGGHGLDLKLVAMDEGFYDREDVAAMCVQMGVAGAILTATAAPGCLSALHVLERRRFPHVRLGGTMGGETLRSPLVRSNLPAAMEATLSMLQKLGHERIGLVAAGYRHEVHKLYDAYRQKLPGATAGWLLPLSYNGTVERWSTYAPGPLLIRGYLETHPELTAIVTEHPAAAWEVAVQCRLAGRSVPDDVSVVSLFDHVMLQGVVPAISAWRDSPRGMGREAAECVVGMLDGGRVKPGEVFYVDHEWMARDSVAPPRENDPAPSEGRLMMNTK